MLWLVLTLIYKPAMGHLRDLSGFRPSVGRVSPEDLPVAGRPISVWCFVNLQEGHQAQKENAPNISPLMLRGFTRSELLAGGADGIRKKTRAEACWHLYTFALQ